MKNILTKIFVVSIFIQFQIKAQVKNNFSEHQTISKKTILTSFLENGIFDDSSETISWKPTIEESKYLSFTRADSRFFTAVDTIFYLKQNNVPNAICVLRTGPSDYPAFGFATFKYEENQWTLYDINKFVFIGNNYDTSLKILKFGPDMFTLAAEVTFSKMGFSSTSLKIFSLNNDGLETFKEIFDARIAEDDEGARDKKDSQFDYKRKVIIIPSKMEDKYGNIVVKTFGKINKKNINSVERYFFDNEINYFVKNKQFLHDTSNLR